MKKNIIIIFVIFIICFILIIGCTEITTDPPEPEVPTEDYIKIKSVTPNSGLTESASDFTIIFEYSLSSLDNAFIDLAFNTGDNSDYFYRYEKISINKVIKEVQYTVNVIPKNHPGDTFRLNIIMYDSSNSVITWAEEILVF